MHSYLIGFFKITVISFFEYTLAFLLIGHPNAILLGFIFAILNLIPYFGGIIANIISLITAISSGTGLFIRTLILFIVLSLVDSYIINPYIYGKTNKVPATIIILAVFIGGTLFKTLGIIISLPLAIIILTTIDYYKKNRSNKFIM